MSAVQMDILSREQAATLNSSATRVGGRVDRVIFQNGENGYCVLAIEPSGCDESMKEAFTAVGYLASIREGDEYLFTGTWKEHAKFGRQFVFDSAEVIMPSSREGIVAYLSDISYGVGPVRAGKIVDALGETALQRIQDEPGCLDSLNFLTPTQRDEIRKHLAEHRLQAELASLICRGPGITPGLAARIVRHYGEDSVNLVKTNPYVLANEMWGVGFLTADKVARYVGIPPDSAFRVEAAVEYVIKEAQNEGHCFLRPRDIVPRVQELLGKESGIEVDNIAIAAGNLIERRQLIREDYAIYTTVLHKAESELAQRINILLNESVLPGRGKLEAGRIGDVVAKVEASENIVYDDRQRKAIFAALTWPLSIVTGGPGCGKTTVTRAIVETFSQLRPHFSIYLASPTGRAAKRLSEATSYEAKTIHRLLEYHPECGFRVNADNPLDLGLLIVDEYSMCDIELANDLFAAIPPGLQVVMVGDSDQLPSVGPGSVLRDLISSQKIPVTRLQYVYRQAAGSEIHRWAHSIKDGIVPPLISNGDVTVICCADQETAAVRAVEQARKAAAEYGVMGFQVLAPMKKGVAGVANLNDEIRQAVNPSGEDLKFGSHVYRPGDKAMVIKNDYDLEVFNGDLGRVVRLVPGDGPKLVVDIDGNEVAFEADKANTLTLAYASTVHKAQGSEFPCVIVVLTRGHYIMLARNLLYTAITRARKRLIVIHQPGSIERAVNNNRIEERYSRLSERLRGP